MFPSMLSNGRMESTWRAGEKDIKLSPEDLTREKMLKILYDYAVYAGYTNEDFGDFVGG